jgi:hypothetical protein
MIAIQLIAILAGIYILAKGKINFSKNRILVRSKSMFLGVLLILIAILPYFIKAANDIFIVILELFIIIVASYFFSKKI